MTGVTITANAVKYCSRCTYRTTSESLIRTHILLRVCGAQYYTEGKP